MTINIRGKYRLLTAILRTGVNQNIVDNIGAGGIRVGINSNGSFKKYGMDKNCNKYVNHPTTNVTFANQTIPQYQRIVDMATYLHRYLYNFKIVSWDIAIAANSQPIIIEYNVFSQGIEMQFNNGPLFGEYTNEVLSDIQVPNGLKYITKFSKMFL